MKYTFNREIIISGLNKFKQVLGIYLLSRSQISQTDRNLNNKNEFKSIKKITVYDNSTLENIARKRYKR